MRRFFCARFQSFIEENTKPVYKMSIMLSAVCLNSVSVLVSVLILREEISCSVVFQPSFLITPGPKASSFLVGNVTDISLTISSVTPSNTTGHLPPPSCVPFSSSQWNLSQEPIGKSALLVRLSLNRSLQLCVNETECCAQPLCVAETVRVSACRGEMLQTSLVVQAKIYALLPSSGSVSENKTVIPNQVFQPLGSCPCDLTPEECDLRCCCDQDCTPELLWLFTSHCLPGPFGGSVTPVPEYNCFSQAADNAPDWFPFLCVTSSSENNPFLGLFYHGQTVIPKAAPSFHAQQAAAPVPPTYYRQGEPIFTTDNQYFTIPQVSMLGQCVENAPVAFLLDFVSVCTRTLQACPNAPTDLAVAVRDGLGDAFLCIELLQSFFKIIWTEAHPLPGGLSSKGMVTVSVVDEVITDLSSFVSPPAKLAPDPMQGAERQLCINVVLALSYIVYWRGNGLTAISVTRRTGNITLDPAVTLTTRYSTVFVNGNVTAQPNSGNPGYQVGRPVIGGLLDSTTGIIEIAPLSLWQAVGDGLCLSAGLRPVLYGLNSTSGCLMSVSLLNLTQCSQLRETVHSVLSGLVPATLVSWSGKPDFFSLANWTQITTKVQNSSQPSGGFAGVCSGVPAHLHIHIRSIAFGTVGGVPQKMIQAVELSFKESTWTLECDTVNGNPCITSDLTQSFPLTSSVTFTHIPISMQPPQPRFRINFTEFDCERNDVCWPELAFPLTPYYTGEPYSQTLAKGLILVFFFIIASVLGRPWRQIRQAWSNTSL